MTGHDPDDTGDDPSDAGDDTDGTPVEDEERPDGWPDDWTTADDDTHSPSADRNDEPGDEAPSETASTDDAPWEGPAGAGGPKDAAEDRPADQREGGHEPSDDGSGGARNPRPTDGSAERSERTERQQDPNAGAETRPAPEATESSDAAAADATEQGSSTLGEEPSPEKPPAPNVEDEPTIEDDGLLTWFRTTTNPFVVLVRDVVSSVAAVAAIGLVLFAISGIWPPLVAVESGSMEPHMTRGDLVFLVDENRYAPQSAIDGTGVSTHQSAQAASGYAKFGEPGDVIVYEPFGDNRETPIIHRARFHVEKGDKWVQDADPEYLGSVDSCSEVPRNMCPAPYDGFITKGDANPTYDQIGDQSTIVRGDWIRGKAQLRIPFLGWIRLQFAKLAVAGPSAFGALGVLTARLGALGLAVGAATVSVRI